MSGHFYLVRSRPDGDSSLLYYLSSKARSRQRGEKATKIQAATAAADSGHHQAAYIENYIGNLADKVTKPKKKSPKLLFNYTF
ncbi:hypothetical protein OB934_00660 [Aeromonas salmonicida]|uniref:hypothetical protein n=1 Tax=Aeromonas salmonicida TaxID=645 RepID=UPI00259E9DBF|nr:hypothetical protein [Aeromonas salmonicida]MDM5061330.1 hypothetical protein [Aeromonas salmonicida]